MSQASIQRNWGLRVLMGPGPSDVHPRVLQAMAIPTLGHMDPDFFTIMDEVMERLRFVFKTTNQFAIPISGTGTAGMEAAFFNLVEEGDRVVVCVQGYFGQRMCEVAERCGGEVTRVEPGWGKAVDLEQLSQVVKEKQPKVVAVVHVETSAGFIQPLQEIAGIAHEAEAFVIADTVASLGGCPVNVDEWDIDVCYSGSQKCLSCPPGLAPLTVNERALSAVQKRRTPVQSLYLDVSLLGQYWGGARVYHHTAPANLIYALREALRLVGEEGLEPRFQRHRLNHRALVAGLTAMGLELMVPEEHRAVTITAVHVPGAADDAAVRKRLLADYGIEIGGGLGPLKGKVWRVGLMGHSSSRNNVLLFLGALEEVLADEGLPLPPGAGVAAAVTEYEKA